jgi:hypothetical protein
VKYAIVNTDNFGRDYPNEWFVAREIPERELAEKMCGCLNGGINGGIGTLMDPERWFKVTENDYELALGFVP